MAESIEYDIVDVDYWENDAILEIGGKRYYFQWDSAWAEVRHPTIIDALDYLKNNGGL